MLTVPVTLTRLIVRFAPLFSKRVWEHVQVLVVGALLAPGQRTVTAVLRVMGLSQERHFENYHRVLNRARWSSLATARVLLEMVVQSFAPSGVVVIGLDDTLERRRGAKIKAKGIYRDPVRSSRSQLVKASGLRWLCAMVLAEIPWAGRVWALPFLTALCPSQRYHQQRGQRHKSLPQWAGQLIGLIHRWLPGRQVVVVTDSSFAVIELLKQVSDTPEVSLISRLRLDAALYDPAPVRVPQQHGRPRKKGARRPTLQQMLTDPQTGWTRLTVAHWYGGEVRAVEVCTETAVWYHRGLPPVAIRWLLIRDPQDEFAPQALVTTQLDHTPAQMLEWFVRRWTMEVTLQEARSHLGIEPQRQWSDLAIGRTTPALFGLYSLVTLLAHSLPRAHTRRVRTAAWYAKPRSTFSDTLAVVRRELWSQSHFSRSRAKSEVVEIPCSLLERLTDAVCYAA
jgi:DDE superfamily endonuclease